MREKVLCSHCGNTEYYDEMKWFSDLLLCRNCYAKEYENLYREKFNQDGRLTEVYPPLGYDQCHDDYFIRTLREEILNTEKHELPDRVSREYSSRGKNFSPHFGKAYVYVPPKVKKVRRVPRVWFAPFYYTYTYIRDKAKTLFSNIKNYKKGIQSS